MRMCRGCTNSNLKVEAVRITTIKRPSCSSSGPCDHHLNQGNAISRLQPSDHKSLSSFLESRMRPTIQSPRLSRLISDSSNFQHLVSLVQSDSGLVSRTSSLTISSLLPTTEFLEVKPVLYHQDYRMVTTRFIASSDNSH